MFDVIKNLVNTVSGLDPRTQAIEAIGNALGVPPVVTEVVKGAVGIATGNYLMTADAAIGLIDELTKQPAKTEYCPPRDGARAECGYAPAAAATTHHATSAAGNPQMFRLDQEGMQFFTSDPAHQGLMAMRQRAVDCGSGSQAFADYMNILKVKLHCDPGLRAQFEAQMNVQIVSANVGGRNEILVRPRNAGSCGTSSSPSAPATSSSGSSSGTGNTSGTGGGKLDPNILQYKKALETLLANYETFDTARGSNDDLLSRANLQAIVSNPNAHPHLKEAANFLLAHPEYYDRLEQAAGIGGRDGIVGRRDVEADLKRVNGEISQHGVASPNSGVSNSSGAGKGGISDILNDPSMSIEEKIEAILLMIADRTDDELLDVMNQMEANSRQQRGLTGDKSEGAQAKSQELQSGHEKLNLKLQKLMEKRKQMFELLSNFSQKFNEMAKTAIQNMARA